MPTEVGHGRHSRVRTAVLQCAAVATLVAVSFACGPDGPDAPGAGEPSGIVTTDQPTPPTSTTLVDTVVAPSPDPALAAVGSEVALGRGCAACHGGDFGGATGPSWIGLAGSTVVLSDGRELVADEAYLRRAIVEPDAEIVDGYIVKMPVVALDDAEIDALIAFIGSLGSGSE